MTSPGLEGRGEVVKPLNLIVVTDGGMSPLSPLSISSHDPHLLLPVLSPLSYPFVYPVWKDIAELV